MFRDTDDLKNWLKWKETCEFEQSLIFQMGILNKLVVYAQPMFGICSNCKTNSFCSVVYKYNTQFCVNFFSVSALGKQKIMVKKGPHECCDCVPDVPVLWICNVLYLSASPSVSPDLLFYQHFCKIMAFIKILTVKVSRASLASRLILLFSLRFKIILEWYLLYWWLCFIPLNKNKYRFVRTWPL